MFPRLPVKSTATCIALWGNDIVVTGDDGSILVYSLSGELVRALAGHQNGIWALKVHGDTLITGSGDHTAKLWNLPSGICQHTFKGHSSPIRCLTISEVGGEARVITASRDGEQCVWHLPNSAIDTDVTSPNEDVGDPNLLFRLNGHEDSISDLSAQGATLVSASYDTTVRVWDLDSGASRWVLQGHTDKGLVALVCPSYSRSRLLRPVYSVIFDVKRDRIYSGAADQTFRIWDNSTGSCQHVLTLNHHAGIVACLSLSSSYLVSVLCFFQGTTWVWNPFDTTLVTSIQIESTVMAMQSDDDIVVLGCVNGQVTVLDIKSGETRILIQGDDDGVRKVKHIVLDKSLCVVATDADEGYSLGLDIWKLDSA